jgi:hypothetical protein
MTIMVIALWVCDADDYKVKSSNPKKPKGANQSLKNCSDFSNKQSNKGGLK